jgi:chemotaxis signal transduction protein
MNNERRFIVMKVGRQNYALPLEQVAEVCELRPLAQVPRAPAWCLGATRSAGVVVAVVDLARYISEEAELQPEKIVVLDLQLGGLALQVGQIASVALEEPARIEKDANGRWLITTDTKFEMLDASELVQEISAAMAC